MDRPGAAEFIASLVVDCKPFLELERLSEHDRMNALHEMGFHYTARELDSYICLHFSRIRPHLKFVGGEDPRDTIMRLWGNCMGNDDTGRQN